jgi:hypothetical protein
MGHSESAYRLFLALYNRCIARFRHSLEELCDSHVVFIAYLDVGLHAS